MQGSTSRFFRIGGLIAIALAGMALGATIGENSPGVLLLLGATGFTALCVGRPVWALLAYLFVYPLLSTFGLSLGAGVPDITVSRAAAVAICAGVWVQPWLGRPMPRAMLGWTEVWMLAFCLVSALSSLFSAATVSFAQTMLDFANIFVIPFVLYVLAVKLFSHERQFGQFALVLMAAAAYLCVIGIYEYWTWQDLLPAAAPIDAPDYMRGLRLDEDTGIVRVNGPFEYPETFGMVLGMIVITLTGCIAVPPEKRGAARIVRRLNWALLPLAAVGLFTNMFRAVWIAAVAGVAVRFGVFRRLWGRMLAITAGAALAVLVGFHALQSTSVYAGRIANLETIETRIATWRIGMMTFLDQPLLGVGFNEYVASTQKRSDVPDSFRDARSVPQAHSSYLAVLVEQGLVGLVAYLLVLGSLCWRAAASWVRADVARKPMVAVSFGLLGMYLLPAFVCKSGHVEPVNVFFLCLMGAIRGILAGERKVV